MKINDETKFELMNKYEQNLYDNNIFNIIGIDEVGRGPIAGPVVVAGVILNPKKPIYGLDDSKKLSLKKRIDLDEQIKKDALCYYISEISSTEIDQIGIADAIRKGVANILNKVNKQILIEHVLIDYMKVDIQYNHDIIKKGDQTSNSIAAASIIAKVYRDQLMEKISKKYPQYSFETNVGYGTKAHIEAINEFGIIKEVHRESFEPVKSIVAKEMK